MESGIFFSVMKGLPGINLTRKKVMVTTKKRTKIMPTNRRKINGNKGMKV